MNPQTHVPPLGDQTLRNKRKKVSVACVYCRKSHITCDDGRPCQRCLRRNVGSKCYDELPETKATEPSPSFSSTNTLSTTTAPFHSPPSNITLEDRDNALSSSAVFVDNEMDELNDFLTNVTSNDHFYLTAADPSLGDNTEERLNEVINAKYKAGFLKPYNYVNGYARLQRYMDQHMSSDSRQRILNVMGTFRPAFRDVAQSLTDVDLILVEEAFDRLLLDYDRVFSAMAIPACLWRRTGEIYKGNKEFASLIDVSVDELRDGRLCIYEIMAEESIVNYWEKYGNIGFDARQKAVLTSCMIRHQKKCMMMSCCFSFTIRRDKFNIPTIIVGNFLPIQVHA